MSRILHCPVPFRSHAIVLTKPNTFMQKASSRRYHRATERMSACRARTGFELVHIGDTIQSMVQVFFDKDIVRGYAFVGRFVYPGCPSTSIPM